MVFAKNQNKSWQLVIHPLVYKRDYKTLSMQEQHRITKTIRKKLTLNPYAYGKALTGTLKGLWRLRIDMYRVIYEIIEAKIVVQVVKVGNRKDSEVYADMEKRLPHLKNFLQ